MISVWKQTTRMVLCDNWITSMCVSGLTQCTVSSERCPTEVSSCSGVQTFDWCSEDVKNKLTKTIQFDALYSFPGDVKFSNTTVEPDLTQQLIWFIHGNRNKQTHSNRWVYLFRLTLTFWSSDHLRFGDANIYRNHDWINLPGPISDKATCDSAMYV